MHVMLQVLYMVQANANDPVVPCNIPQADGKMGLCANILFMLLDGTRLSFVNSTFANLVRHFLVHHHDIMAFVLSLRLFAQHCNLFALVFPSMKSSDTFIIHGTPFAECGEGASRADGERYFELGIF
jgi:hypothetical protein